MREDSLKRGKRQNRFSQLARFWRRRGKQYCAIALCASLIAGHVGNMASAADDGTSNDYEFELDRVALYEALQEAVSEGQTVDEDFAFAGEQADTYASLLEADGNLYELTPEIEDNSGALQLRIFARLDGEIELDSAYDIDGSEEMIFLLTNSSDKEKTAVISVDEKVTEQIKVAPKSAVLSDEQAKAYKSAAELSGGPGVMDETSAAADNGIVISGGSGGGGSSGGGGGGSGSDSKVKVVDEDKTEAESGKTEEETNMDQAADESGAGQETEEKENKEDENQVEEDHNGVETGDAVDKGHESDSTAGDSSGSGADITIDTDTDQDNADVKEDSNVKVDEPDQAEDSDKADSGDADKEKADSQDDDADDEKAGDDSSDKDEEGDQLAAAISIHKTYLVTATPSDAEGEEEEATPSDATDSDANKDMIDGTVYDTVRMDGEAVAAYVTTTDALDLSVFDLVRFAECPEFNPEPYVASNGVTVTLHAEAGVIPAGTTVEVKEVTEQVEAAVKEMVDAEAAEENRVVVEMLVYDITLYDANGNNLDDSWSENGKVQVTFSGDTITEKSKNATALEVRHIKTDKDIFESVLNIEDIESVEKVSDTVKVPKDNSVDSLTFDAEHFSQYGVMLLADDTGTTIPIESYYPATVDTSGASINEHYTIAGVYVDADGHANILIELKKNSNTKTISNIGIIESDSTKRTIAIGGGEQGSLGTKIIFVNNSETWELTSLNGFYYVDTGLSIKDLGYNFRITVDSEANGWDIPAPGWGIELTLDYSIQKYVYKVGESSIDNPSEETVIVNQDDAVIYKIVVSNDGDIALSDIVVTENKPDGLELLGWSESDGEIWQDFSPSDNGTYVLGEHLSLGVSNNQVYFVKARVTGDVIGSDIVNTVEMSSEALLPKSDSASIIVPANDLTIIKKVQGIDAEFIAGEPYQFEVKAADGTTALKENATYNDKFGNSHTVGKDGKISITINGESSLTIKDLPLGTYEITESAIPDDLTDYYYVGNDGSKKAELTSDSPGNVTITNTYAPYTSLEVEKIVTGNMADMSKTFSFTATLLSSTGEAIDFLQPTAGDGYSVEGNVATFSLGNGDIITLKKLPSSGAKLIISEDNKGYEVVVKQNNVQINDKDNKFDHDVEVGLDISNGRVTFTNDKTLTIDAGIILDSLPYVLILAAAIAGAAFYFIRKKKDDESNLD